MKILRFILDTGIWTITIGAINVLLGVYNFKEYPRWTIFNIVAGTICLVLGLVQVATWQTGKE